jgi:hypothetical protein
VPPQDKVGGLLTAAVYAAGLETGIWYGRSDMLFTKALIGAAERRSTQAKIPCARNHIQALRSPYVASAFIPQFPDTVVRAVRRGLSQGPLADPCYRPHAHVLRSDKSNY